MEYFPERAHKGEMQEIQGKLLQGLVEWPDHLIFFFFLQRAQGGAHMKGRTAASLQSS